MDIKESNKMTKQLTIGCVQKWFRENKEPLVVSKIKPDTTSLNSIRIIYIHNGSVSFIDERNNLRIEIMIYLSLDLYHSPYQPVALVTLYECIDSDSNAVWCNDEGYKYRFDINRFHNVSYMSRLDRKLGRTININPETGEIEHDNGL